MSWSPWLRCKVCASIDLAPGGGCQHGEPRACAAGRCRQTTRPPGNSALRRCSEGGSGRSRCSPSNRSLRGRYCTLRAKSASISVEIAPYPRRKWGRFEGNLRTCGARFHLSTVPGNQDSQISFRFQTGASRRSWSTDVRRCRAARFYVSGHRQQRDRAKLVGVCSRAGCRDRVDETSSQPYRPAAFFSN